MHFNYRTFYTRHNEENFEVLPRIVVFEAKFEENFF